MEGHSYSESFGGMLSRLDRNMFEVTYVLLAEQGDTRIAVNAHSTSYPSHTFIESEAGQDDGAAAFWNIDGDAIHFAAAVQAEGWVGFGISEAGKKLKLLSTSQTIYMQIFKCFLRFVAFFPSPG